MSDNKINVGAHVNLPTGGGQGRGAGEGVGQKNLPQGDGTPEYGPVNDRGNGRGNGNAYGLRKQGNQGGQNNDVTSRVRENESQAQQIRNRVENGQPKSERLGDDTPGRDRNFEGGRTRGDDDGGSRRNDGVQLRTYVGDDRSRTQADDGRPRTTFDDQRGLLEQSNSPGNSEFGHSHNSNGSNNSGSPLSNVPNALGLGTTQGSSQSGVGRRRVGPPPR